MKTVRAARTSGGAGGSSGDPTTLTLDSLRKDYANARDLALRFCQNLTHEVGLLLSVSGVSLGVPLESRVKSWESVAGKIERLSLRPKSVKELDDLVGLRLMLLFRRDLAKVSELITQNFRVVSQEDTSQRLADTQFGYQSLHYVVEPPLGWLSIQSFRGCEELKAEIQVRTLAQHIWAAASHVLQYKHEASVPPPVRRSIYRVSALLETVDLEFERVLDERDSYISKLQVGSLRDEPLNVDLLSEILDERLPRRNKVDSEGYADLLKDLQHFGVDRSKRLIELITNRLDAALAADARQAGSKDSGTLSGPVRETTDPLLNRIKTLLWSRSTKFVSSCLEHASGWYVDDEQVCFLFRRAGSASFWMDVLSNRENAESVRAACSEVLGRSVRVQLALDAHWTHVDLVRHMMSAEFGDKWKFYDEARKPEG